MAIQVDQSQIESRSATVPTALRSVSIIIPFSKQDTINNAIESVVAQDYPSDLKEIIVVGKGSRTLQKRWPEIRTIDIGPIYEPGRARNMGAAEATGEVLLFLDDDCEAQKGWIRENLIELEDTEVGAVSGMIKGKSKAYFARCVDFANFAQCQSTRRTEGRLWSATFSIRRDVFNEIGGFNEDIRVQEDIDLCFRLNQRGYKTIYQPKVKVLHNHGRTTLSSLITYQYTNGRESGLSVESKYKSISYRNRLLYHLQNPLAYTLMVLPFSIAGTMSALRVNLKQYREIMPLSPFIFLGKVSCHMGILRSLFEKYLRGSWMKYGRIQTVMKLIEYGLLKDSFKTPRVLTLFVTSLCNARCQHCFYWQNLNKNQDLTYEEIDKLSRSFGKLDKLLLSGGEPFLRHDLPEICQLFFDNCRVGMVSIPTNGLKPSLIRHQLERILVMAEGRSVRLNISLDGTETVHDQLRGVPGSFRKVVETYRMACSMQEEFPNLAIGINSCVTDANYEDLFQLFEEFPSLFPQVDLPGLILLRGDPYKKSLKLPSAEKLEKLHQHMMTGTSERQPLLWKLADRANFNVCLETIRMGKQVIPCEAGRILGVVEDNGDVKHCELLPPFGNLREGSFSDIWNSHEAKVARQKIVEKRCRCTHECNIFESLLAHPLYGLRAIFGDEK